MCCLRDGLESWPDEAVILFLKQVSVKINFVNVFFSARAYAWHFSFKTGIPTFSEFQGSDADKQKQPIF